MNNILNNRNFFAFGICLLVTACSEPMSRLHQGEREKGLLSMVAGNDTVQIEVKAWRNRQERNISLLIESDRFTDQNQSVSIEIDHYATASTYDSMDDSVWFPVITYERVNEYFTREHLHVSFFYSCLKEDSIYVSDYFGRSGYLMILKDDSETVEGEFELTAHLYNASGESYDSIICKDGYFKIPYSGSH